MADSTPHIEPASSASGSLAPEYFELLYAASADPWEFESSAYEAAKYTATLAALPHQHYASVLELGCSIGVLTRRLALRCDRLLATDVSEAALARARYRCVDLSSVEFEQRDLSVSFPSETFDLILVSEVGYYFSLPDLEILRSRIRSALVPGGHLLLVHYRGETNYPLTATTVHDTFLAWEKSAWTRLKTAQTDGYLLDLLERLPESTAE